MPTDPYVFSDSVWIEATPGQVYDVVSDVTRTGEWSVFTRSCEWEAGDGAAVGAHFVGHNSRPGRDWDTRSTVTVAEPGRAFAWELVDGGVRWAYEMAPERSSTGAEGTRLTHSWRLTAAGRATLAARFPDDPEDQIALRVTDAHTSIPTTLAALRMIFRTARVLPPAPPVRRPRRHR